jgi:hypothetical protein
MLWSLVLAMAFAFLMWSGRGTNFFFDDWAWVEFRRVGLHAIVDSYNQHLVIVPVALYRFLFATVGLGHYWVFRAFQAAAHLCCAAVAFEFVRRRVGVVALLVVLPFLVLGSGSDYVLLPINVGFVLSIALGVGALLVLEGSHPHRDLTVCLLLVIATACSEFAAVFSIGIAVESRMRDRSFRRAWVWAIPLALYAMWWIAFFSPGPGQHVNLGAAPGFALNLAANAIGGLFGLDIFWGRLLLVAAAVLVYRHVKRTGAVTPRLAGLLVTAVAFWLLVGVGRDVGGDFTASRYVYTGALLIVLILAEAFRGTRLDGRGIVIVSLIALIASAGNISKLAGSAGFLRSASSRVSAELGALQLARQTVPRRLGLDSGYAPVVFAGPYLTAIGAIGSSPAYSIQHILSAPAAARLAADGLLIRAGNLRAVDATPGQAPLGSPPLIEGSLGGESITRGPCVQLLPNRPSATLDLRLAVGNTVLVNASRAPAAIRARRLAAGFGDAPIAEVPSPGVVALRSARDRSSLPWHIRVSSAASVQVCGTS